MASLDVVAATLALLAVESIEEPSPRVAVVGSAADPPEGVLVKGAVVEISPRVTVIADPLGVVLVIETVDDKSPRVTVAGRENELRPEVLMGPPWRGRRPWKEWVNTM